MGERYVFRYRRSSIAEALELFGPAIYGFTPQAAASAPGPDPCGPSALSHDFCHDCGLKLQSERSKQIGRCTACQEKFRQIGPDRPKG